MVPVVVLAVSAARDNMLCQMGSARPPVAQLLYIWIEVNPAP
jgi:hypothetical protein